MKNSMLILENGRIFTPTDTILNGSVGISDNGLIQSISAGSAGSESAVKKIDLKGRSLIPGMINIHVHGGLGVTFGLGDLESDLEKYSRFAASHGVTGFLLTICGSTPDAIAETIRKYVQILEQDCEWPGAIPLGLHLEGPFFNKEKHGAFNPSWIHDPNPDEVHLYLDAGRGWIKHISMAPELPGAEQAAQMFSEAGVVVSLGHSNTNYSIASAALKGYFSHVTHTFNAQSPLHQREPGVIGAVLSSDKITAELIGDRLHVHPEVMKILYRCLGPDRIILITDAMSGAGMPDGVYDLLNQIVIVKNGSATLPDGTIGGSTSTMDTCLRTVVELAGFHMRDAVRMVSLNPARLIKKDDRIGSTEVGKQADLVVIDDSFKVQKTFIKGKLIYSNEGEL